MNRSFVRFNRRLALLTTAVVAFGLLFFLVQALVTAVVADTNTRSPQAQPVTQTVTPTVSFDNALREYLDAHTVQGPLTPALFPRASAPGVRPAGGLTYSVALTGTTLMMGAPGSTVAYNLIVSNTGTLTDTFLISQASTWLTMIPTDTFTLTAGSDANVIINVTIPIQAMQGDTDTAIIQATSQSDALISATLMLTTVADYDMAFLPIIYTTLSAPALSATRPNSSNDWQMNWTVNNSPFLQGFELQESQDATFGTGVTTYQIAPNTTSRLINTHEPSSNNIYYYRVRAMAAQSTSPWSNVVKVISAYYDEFDNNQSGWSGPTLKEGLRRLTFIEKIDAWYEWPNNDRWFIIRVEDSWDWGIASPMKPAPELPYSIEFRSKPANLGNLLSHGVVFGGDWNGQPCPDWSTPQGVYAHNICFNHFYNTNLIWYGDQNMRMLWERVDQLVYCPSCGGSPLKRLGDLDFDTNVVELDVYASGWNDYRIEVREDSIKFYVNNHLEFTYDVSDDPNALAWIHDPYFGVFASTDEYSNSTWRYEYIKVTPLDN